VNWRRTPVILAPVLSLAIGAAYWSGLRAPFQFDDVDAIVENAAIRHWWPFAQDLPASVQVAGRPIVALSYAFNFQFAGIEPFGYRLVNLLIHFACALLLFAIARDALSRTQISSRAEPLAAGRAKIGSGDRPGPATASSEGAVPSDLARRAKPLGGAHFARRLRRTAGAW